MWMYFSQLSAIPLSVRSELGRFALVWRFQYPISTLKLSLKRMVDLLGALTALTLASPMLLLVALGVKLTSKGPILYRQVRVGKNGALFGMYKFRSMRIDAEANGPVWSSGAGDPRLTPIGGFLRHSHVDELPQLWNVLRGVMSLVGPRPERPHFVSQLDQLIPDYHHRHIVKPGITGLAQVYYRYDTTVADVKKKLRFDRLYVQRLGLRLDMMILLRTASTIFFRRLLPYMTCAVKTLAKLEPVPAPD